MQQDRPPAQDQIRRGIRTLCQGMQRTRARKKYSMKISLCDLPMIYHLGFSITRQMVLILDVNLDHFNQA